MMISPSGKPASQFGASFSPAHTRKERQDSFYDLMPLDDINSSFSMAIQVKTEARIPALEMVPGSESEPNQSDAVGSLVNSNVALSPLSDNSMYDDSDSATESVHAPSPLTRAARKRRHLELDDDALPELPLDNIPRASSAPNSPQPPRPDCRRSRPLPKLRAGRKPERKQKRARTRYEEVPSFDAPPSFDNNRTIKQTYELQDLGSSMCNELNSMQIRTDHKLALQRYLEDYSSLAEVIIREQAHQLKQVQTSCRKIYTDAKAAMKKQGKFCLGRLEDAKCHFQKLESVLKDKNSELEKENRTLRHQLEQMQSEKPNENSRYQNGTSLKQQLGLPSHLRKDNDELLFQDIPGMSIGDIQMREQDLLSNNSLNAFQPSVNIFINGHETR